MIKLILISAVLAGTAAIAQAPADPPASKRGPGTDPGEVVCIKQAQIGSRVATRRVCRTRAEWSAHRKEFRDEIDRAQQQSQTQY